VIGEIKRNTFNGVVAVISLCAPHLSSDKSSYRADMTFVNFLMWFMIK